MIDADVARDIIHDGASLTRSDKLLVLLAIGDDPEVTVAVVKDRAKTVGLGVRDWNLSSVLARSAGCYRGADGWGLTQAGKTSVTSLVGTPARPTTTASRALRLELVKVKHADVVGYLEETIECLEAGLLRAAVTMSWVGAVAILQDVIVAKHLAAFNTEATRRDKDWRTAKRADDLGRMKEHDFLNVLEGIGVLGKNVKQELQTCLQLRNGCGHPNSLSIGENKVAAHMETLILNVYRVFV